MAPSEGGASAPKLKPKYHQWNDPLPPLGPDANTKLRIFCGIWNLHGQHPPADISAFLPKEPRHHIYVVGTCECEQSISKSFVFASKAKWEKQVKEHLGEQEYIIAGSHTLNAIHVMVLLHRYVWKYSWDIRTAQVATGFANVVGNKGGTQVSFSVGKTSMLFTNCHLAAHQNKMKERTENMRRILQDSPLRRVKSIDKGSSYAKASGIHEEFDRVFLFGDLNPRLNAERKQVDEWIEENAMSKLLDVDQLLPLLRGTGIAESASEGDILWTAFKEQKIEFPPTYKFDKNTDDYDSGKKQRIPSWTDRILWKADDGIKALSYGSISSMYVSDHRPVYAQFEADVDLENWEGPTTQETSSICSVQ